VKRAGRFKNWQENGNGLLLRGMAADIESVKLLLD